VIDRQQFIKATDYLKEHYKLTFGEMAEAIDEKEHAITNIRRGSKKPSAFLIEKMRKQYPQLDMFFATNVASEDVAHEPMVLYSDGNAWKEAYLTQKKLIELQNLELERLRKDVERLGAENKALKDIFKERDRKI